MTTSELMKTILGALIGLSIPYIIKSIVYIFRRFRRSRIEGSWYAYHATLIDDRVQVINTTWEFTKGFSSQFVVTTYKKINDKSVVYAKGTLNRERNFLLIKLKTIEHEEGVSMRFLDPVEPADSLTWGLWLSFDYHGDLFAGPIVISRKELQEKEYFDYITTKIDADDKYKILRTHRKSK